MNESISINRLTEDYSLIDFKKLKAEAVKNLENMTGEIWTDYNIHDPGITILEQICYALTDIINRCDFDINDLLTNEDGNIDFHSFSLKDAIEIYPSQPVTFNDYRKIIFDDSYDIINLWISKSKRNNINGVYDLIVECTYEEEENGKIEALKEEVRKKIIENRNLCEDIDQIVILKRKPVLIKTEIEINNKYSPEEILAEIYFRIYQYFNNSISIVPYDEIITENNLENIFTGPYTKSGYIEEHKIPDKKQEFYISDLIKELSLFDGIQSIKHICFNFENRDYFDKIIFRYSNEGPTIFQIPQTSKDTTIHITKENKTLAIDYEEVRRRFYKKKSETVAVRKTRIDFENYVNKPNGKHLDITDYYSIQNQFPYIYGINEFGVAPFESEKRKAQAKQLKTYLVFFEQILINYLAQLNSVKDLFTINETVQYSYFSNNLDDIPGSKNIYKNYLFTDKKDITELLKIVHKFIPADENNRNIFKYEIEDSIINYSGKQLLGLFYFYRDATVSDELQKNKFLEDLRRTLEQWFDKEDRKLNYIINGIEMLLMKEKSLAGIDVSELKKDLTERWRTFPEKDNSKIEKIGNKLWSLIKKSENKKKGIIGFLQKEISDILQEYQTNSYKNILKNYDNFLDRRNRFLDVVLGFYGETFQQNSLKRFNYYGLGDNFERDILHNKILFLKDIVRISRDKSKAFNYSESLWDIENIAGAKRKTYRLLGIDFLEERKFSDVFNKYGLHIIRSYEETNIEPWIEIYREDSELPEYEIINKHFFSIPYDQDYQIINDDDIEMLLENLDIFNRANIVNDFLRYGINIDKYKIGKAKDEEEFIVIFNTESANGWIVVSKFKSFNVAIKLINKLVAFLIIQNKKNEGFHIVEHILLRNQEDKYRLFIRNKLSNTILFSYDFINYTERDRILESLQKRLNNKNFYEIIELENHFKIYFEYDSDKKFLLERQFESKLTAENFIDEIKQDFKYGHIEFVKKRITWDDIIIDDDFYSNRISIILPNWSARFNNSKFQILVAETIEKVFPAHLYPRFYWFDINKMTEFEKLYSEWVDSKRENSNTTKSKEIIKFLESNANYKNE